MGELQNDNWCETGHNYSRKAGNWTEADDWNCGTHDDRNGMSGFDSYDESDLITNEVTLTLYMPIRGVRSKK